MSIDRKPSIVTELKNLLFDEVANFDDETVSGEGLAYYESAQIFDAVVFHNKLSARVGNYFESRQVRVEMHGKEITSFCTCEDGKQMCIHAVALLYAWVNDAADFMDLETVLLDIGKLEKARLVEIVKNILQQQPHLAHLFLQNEKPDWDEIDADPLI